MEYCIKDMENSNTITYYGYPSDNKTLRIFWHLMDFNNTTIKLISHYDKSHLDDTMEKEYPLGHNYQIVPIKEFYQDFINYKLTR